MRLFDQEGVAWRVEAIATDAIRFTPEGPARDERRPMRPFVVRLRRGKYGRPRALTSWAWFRHAVRRASNWEVTEVHPKPGPPSRLDLIDTFLAVDRSLSSLFDVPPAHAVDVAAYVSELEAMPVDQLRAEQRKLQDLRDALRAALDRLTGASR